MGWTMRSQRNQVRFSGVLPVCHFEAAGLALDGNVSSVTTSQGHDVDADVLISRLRKNGFHWFEEAGFELSLTLFG